jgi:hypothetical protein
MAAIDYKKLWQELYAPPAGEFTLVEVPELRFLMVDGRGNPNTAPEYAAALEALYGVAYGAKMACKRELGLDYVVPPLEGLWWADDMAAFLAGDKDRWQWTMMIMLPDAVPDEIYAAAVDKAARKTPDVRERLRLESYAEGLSAQIMHLGPYDDEAPTLARLHHEYLPANGLAPSGRHHEIYLGDPRRTAPEKLRTVLRQPVRRV